MKNRTIRALAALLLVLLMICGCGGKAAKAANAAVGTWQDEGKNVTFEFKNDGTGTLKIYVAMFKSTTENEIEYICEDNTIRWGMPGEEEYETFTISNDAIEYGGMELKKQ